jgi:hypothetical protein
MFNFLETLKEWKNKPYFNSNYKNIKIFYDDYKYIKMDPKTQISLTEGVLHLILKHPKEWVKQVFDLKKDVTLVNHTNRPLFFCVKNSLLYENENQLKLEVRNGVPE